MGCCSSSSMQVGPLRNLPAECSANIVRLTPESPSALIEEALEVVALSFAGTTTNPPDPTISWVIDPRGNVDNDASKPLKAEPSRERIAFMRWVGTWSLKTMWQYGGCFALRGDSVDGGEQPIVAVTVSVPPSDKAIWDLGICAQIDASNKCGVDPHAKSGASASRFLTLEKTLKKSHKKHAPGRHWFTQILAVKPEAQGQGYGRRLLNMITAFADEDGVPVYLETSGSRNSQFYVKNGFEVAERVIAKDKKDKTAPDEHVLIMLRQPKPHT